MDTPAPRVILDALSDAADYRRRLAAECPDQCAALGYTCEACADNLYAADTYEHLAGILDAGPPPPPEHTIRVRGGLL